MERDPGAEGDRPHADSEDVEEAVEAEEADAARRNPDPQTRRETIELDLMEEDESELGEHIGDEIP